MIRIELEVIRQRIVDSNLEFNYEVLIDNLINKALKQPDKVKQVVVHDVKYDVNFASVPSVDRCTSCHLGIDNPDFVEITLHSYRHRHRNAPGDPILECIETSLSHSPPIEVPTVVLRGGDSGFGRPSISIDTDRSHFTNLIESQVVDGGGHDLPVQKPSSVSDSIRKLITDHI